MPNRLFLLILLLAFLFTGTVYAEENDFRWAGHIRYDWDHAGQYGTATQTWIFAVKFKETKYLEVVDSEDNLVGSLVKLEDDESFFKVSEQGHYITEGNEHSFSGGGSGSGIMIHSAWIYYSLSEDDPLKKYLPNGTYNIVAQTPYARYGTKSHIYTEFSRGTSYTKEETYLLHRAFDICRIETIPKLEDENKISTDAILQCLSLNLSTLVDMPMTDSKLRVLEDGKMTGSYSFVFPKNCKHVISWEIEKQIDVDAVLKPADQDEGTGDDYFEVGETREYILTINSPDPEDIEAIRFKLTDVSTHPGIATNAGNHIYYTACPDCRTGKKDLGAIAQAKFKTFDTRSDSYQWMTISRRYNHYNDCVIDEIEDMFFKEEDNPDYELVDEIECDLQYDISTHIMRGDINENEFLVKVYIKDTAASGLLSAELNIDGTWYETSTEGQLANDDKTKLMLPRDKDKDGIHDHWEEDYGRGDPLEDEDNIPESNHKGDGLTNFEEYRGIIIKDFDPLESTTQQAAESNHCCRRLDPTVKNLFFHDYCGFFQDIDIDNIVPEIKVIKLQGDEFYEEVINFKGSRYKNGDQYVLVGMTDTGAGITLKPSVSGIASHVGPPQENYNTIVLKNTSSDFKESLTHEIGHNINIHHHGEHDKTEVRLPMFLFGKAYVAMPHQQHSGFEDCYMRYECADAYYDGSRYKFWPLDVYGNKYDFCGQKGGESFNKTGFAGTAQVGNCRCQIKIKSY